MTSEFGEERTNGTILVVDTARLATEDRADVVRLGKRIRPKFVFLGRE